ncbi:MAG TPA: AMP-binding protein [Gemmataceae bacterium]|jgi:fatty-acyl-CoA synthase
MAGLHDSATVGDIVTSVLRRFPDRVAFRQDGKELTYRQTADLLARWVTVLRDRGLCPGQGVGLLSPNRPEAWLAQMAPALAGGRYTALHPMGSLDDHLYVCDEAELRFLLVDPAYGERATQLLEKSGAVESLFTFGPSEAGEDLNELTAHVSPGQLDRGPQGPDDVCYLLYTGGTTGVPKAAMLSEQSVANLAYGTSLGWDLPSDIRYLAVAPISHAAGMMILPTLLRGGTIVLHRSFDPAAWLQAIASEQITVSLLVPTMIYSVLDDPTLGRADLSSLEAVMYGASPIAPTRLLEGIERIGQVFCQLYGQTESFGQGTSLWRSQHDPADPQRLTSCGTPMPFTRVSIRDDDDQPVPDGAPGEICLQGPSIMQGYWKQPELTASALAGGWLHTGDIGIRDDAGFFYLVDRKKDMIVSGGFNVFPREIEDVLCEHPALSSAAVIGVPDQKWGEAVKALVVLRPGSMVQPEELVALVRDRKGPIYAPKTIEYLDSLPLTPVGKADKKKLRSHYWAGRDRQIG